MDCNPGIGLADRASRKSRRPGAVVPSRTVLSMSSPAGRHLAGTSTAARHLKEPPGGPPAPLNETQAAARSSTWNASRLPSYFRRTLSRLGDPSAGCEEPEGPSSMSGKPSRRRKSPHAAQRCNHLNTGTVSVPGRRAGTAVPVQKSRWHEATQSEREPGRTRRVGSAGSGWPPTPRREELSRRPPRRFSAFRPAQTASGYPPAPADPRSSGTRGRSGSGRRSRWGFRHRPRGPRHSRLACA